MTTNASCSILVGEWTNVWILYTNLIKIINNLQYSLTNLALVFVGQWMGVHPQPSCLQGRPLDRSLTIDATCVLEKTGTKSMHIFIKVGEIRGRTINLLKHVFALHSLPIIFSKIFSLATLARLYFIIHLEMQSCNVLYQPHLGLYFIFLCHFARLTASKIHWKVKHA